MTHHDEFFTPEDVDRQIDQASQPGESDRADVEMLAYLRNYYQLEAPREQEMLARIWSRIEPALIEEQENGRQDRPARGGTTLTRWPPQRPAEHSRRTLLMQRLEVPAAVLLLAALIAGMTYFFTIRGTGAGHSTLQPTPVHAPTASPLTSCAALLPGATPLGPIAGFPEVTLPAGTNPVASSPTTQRGGPAQFSLTTYSVCFTGTIGDVTAASQSLEASLLAAGWKVSLRYPFDTQYHQACSSSQVCLYSMGSVPGRELEIAGLTAHLQRLVTFSMILALPPAAPSCGTNFSNSPIQGFQTSLSTDYGIVPLPPVTLETQDDATGHRGDDLCSPGTATMVATFLSTYMPENGWTSYSSTAQQQIWKSSSGCIAILIQDPTQWIVSWPNPNIGSTFSDCPP